MLSNRLTRIFSQVVLASYLTQLLAPVVHASETLTLPPIDYLAKDRFNGRDIPPIQRFIAKTPKLMAPPIDEERVRSEAETYQYELRIKTVNSKATNLLKSTFMNLLDSLANLELAMSWLLIYFCKPLHCD